MKKSADREIFFFIRLRRSLRNKQDCGEVPERSKGTDCKSVGEAFGGSNPPLPTTVFPGRYYGKPVPAGYERE